MPVITSSGTDPLQDPMVQAMLAADNTAAPPSMRSGPQPAPMDNRRGQAPIGNPLPDLGNLPIQAAAAPPSRPSPVPIGPTAISGQVGAPPAQPASTGLVLPPGQPQQSQPGMTPTGISFAQTPSKAKPKSTYPLKPVNPASIFQNDASVISPVTNPGQSGGILGSVLGSGALMPQPSSGGGGSKSTLVPDELSSQYSNGKLPSSALTPIGQSGHSLYAPAASAWTAMVAAAKASGIDLSVTDSYRSYDEQVDCARRKGIYGKGGMCAVPGTSKHGWGIALDINVNDKKTLEWIRANAGQYGFAQPGGPGGQFSKDEPWHWEWQGSSGKNMPTTFMGSASAQRVTPNNISALMAGIGGVASGIGTLGPNAPGMPKGIAKLLNNPYVAPNPFLNKQQAGSAIGSGIGALLQGLGGGGSNTPSGQTGTYGYGAVANPNSPKYNASQIAQVAYNAGFRGNDLAVMVAIALGESGGNVGAHNPKGEDSRGLWQINVAAHGDRFPNLYDPASNAAAAWALFNDSGFKPWTVYTRGKYKEFMSQALAAVQALGYM